MRKGGQKRERNQENIDLKEDKQVKEREDKDCDEVKRDEEQKE